jgi:hypothetical protein
MRWDDPAVRIDWQARNPIVSPRVRANPRLAELPADDLPR